MSRARPILLFNRPTTSTCEAGDLSPPLSAFSQTAFRLESRQSGSGRVGVWRGI
jgi:hypothetical protein